MNISIAQSPVARRADKEKGFTLIELLVVVVIIGILAAIAIPTFLNQRQTAWEAQVKSDISNAVIAAETIAVNNNGSYSTIVATDALKNAGYKATTDVHLTPTYTAAAGTVAAYYSFTVLHDKYTTLKWVYDGSTGVTTASAK